MEKFQAMQINEDDDGSATFGSGVIIEDVMQFLRSKDRTLVHIPAFSKSLTARY